MKKIEIKNVVTNSIYTKGIDGLQMHDFCILCYNHISTRECDDDGIPGEYIWKEGDFHYCEEAE